MKFFYSFIIIFIAVILSVIADVYLKKSQLSNVSYVLLGVFLYASEAVPVAVGFRFVDFSVVFFIWGAISVVLGLILGIVIFKEQFSLMKLAAFASAMIALVFSYLASR